jgi:hypothetical protein
LPPVLIDQTFALPNIKTKSDLRNVGAMRFLDRLGIINAFDLGRRPHILSVVQEIDAI